MIQTYKSTYGLIGKIEKSGNENKRIWDLCCKSIVL